MSGFLRRRGAAVALATVAAVALAACSSSSSSNSSGGATDSKLIPMKIVLASFAGDTFPLYIAQSQGLFTKYGLDVSVTTAQTTVQYTELATGGADFAWGSSNVIETAAKTNGAVKVVGTLGVNATELLVTSDIHSPADLKGKKVGASAPGSVGDVGVQAYLGLSGLKAGRDYTMEYFSGQFAAANTALAQQQIQALYDEPPYLFQTMAANPTLHSIGRIDQSKIGATTGDVFAVNTAWAKANPDAITDFAKAWRAAIALSLSNKALAVQAIEKGDKVSAAMASQWYQLQAKNNVFGPFTQDDFNVDVQQLDATYSGLDQTANYASIVDNSYADAK